MKYTYTKLKQIKNLYIIYSNYEKAQKEKFDYHKRKMDTFPIEKKNYSRFNDQKQCKQLENDVTIIKF